MTHEQILEKARKLLSLRDRASTRGEAEAAARALSGILEKYRIEIAQLDMSQGKSDVFVADRHSPLVTWHRATSWRRALCECLCLHYGVASWRQKVRFGDQPGNGRKRYRTAIHLCGRQEDMEMVRYMFAWLSAEVTRLAKDECAGKGLRFSNSWMLGFVNGIDKQLRESRDEACVATSTEVAMVLRARHESASEAMNEQVKNLRTVNYTAHYYSGAYLCGEQRGSRHHLGKSVDSNCRQDTCAVLGPYPDAQQG